MKLAAPLGAVLAAAAWPALPMAAALAAALTAAAGVGRARHRRAGPRVAPLPHGPSMLVAAWTVVAGAAAVGAGAG